MGMFAASKAVVSLDEQDKTGFEHCTSFLLIEFGSRLKVWRRLEGGGPKTGWAHVWCVCVRGCARLWATHTVSGLTFSISQ